MKYTKFLPLVAVAATAIVIPDEAMAQQLVLEPEAASPARDDSWWDGVTTSLGDLRNTVEDTFSSSVEAFDDAVQSVSSSLSDFDLDAADFLPSWSWDSLPGGSGRPGRGGRRGRHGRHGHGTTNLTLYQAIHASKYTTKIAKLVDKYPDIVATLNSTAGGNLTFFVPTDRAFEKIPEHGHDNPPPREFVEKLLLYHVVPGLYPAGRVLSSHTLPTALKEEALGSRSQRLRVSLSLAGLRVNFYSKVIAANIFTSNGVIHGVDSLLVPPPPTGKIIELFPAKFSTFILAVEKTGLFKDLQHYRDATTGGTVFAPTNLAFQKLGPAANAFLFNTEKGLGYLKAILKYHLVANETLYSDAYYGRKAAKTTEGDGDSDVGVDASSRYHVDLPTLLGDKSIAVDVARWGGFITVKLNGFVRVAVQDVVARDSVIQVVNSVLIPPHRHRGGDYVDDGQEIDVEELIERLEPYVGNGKDWSVGEL